MSVACRPFFYSLSPIDLSWLDAQNVCDVLFESRYTNIDDLWQVRFAASGRGGGGLLRVHWTLPAQSAGPAIVGSLLHEAVPQRTSRRSPYAIRQKVKCHNNKTNKHKHTHTHTPISAAFHPRRRYLFVLMQICVSFDCYYYSAGPMVRAAYSKFLIFFLSCGDFFNYSFSGM